MKIIIIEDDKKSSEYLSEILEQNFPEIDIIGYSDNVKDSVILLNTTSPEIVFMDIELLDGNAFQILDHINNYDFEVIFTTAYDNYLEKSIAYYAFNFIKKPLETDKITMAVERYRSLKHRLFNKQRYDLLKEFIIQSRLLLHTGDEHIAINLDDVLFCEADGNYTLFLTSSDKKIHASKSLKYYENLLSDRGFFRANRSHLINTKHIASIYKKESVTLTSGQNIIISVRNRSKLTELIKIFS